jgi:cyanate lyase
MLARSWSRIAGDVMISGRGGEGWHAPCVILCGVAGGSCPPSGARQSVHPIFKERDMKRSDLTEKLLDIKRDNAWSWKHICEKIGGFSDVLIVGAILGQMKLTKPQAANAAELFGLSKSEAAMLNEIPMRGEGTPMPPTDPLIYRLYELVMVNGPAWKALIEEEFGDGIMSAIDFDMALERVANAKGDRVKITMSGKFLPFKYYGATGNIQEYGFKEE